MSMVRNFIKKINFIIAIFAIGLLWTNVIFAQVAPVNADFSNTSSSDSTLVDANGANVTTTGDGRTVTTHPDGWVQRVDFPDGSYSTCTEPNFTLSGMATGYFKAAWYNATLRSGKAAQAIKNNFTKQGVQDCTFYPAGGGDPITTNGYGKSEDGVYEGCTPLPIKVADFSKCAVCSLYTSLFNGASLMSEKAYTNTAPGVLKLLIIGTALWLLIFVLKFVGAPTQKSGAEFWKDVLPQLFKVLIAYIFVKYGNPFLYDNFIAPIFNAGLEFGSAMAFNANENGFMCGMTSASDNVQMGAFPLSMHEQIICLIESVQNETAYIKSLGSTLMCVSRNAASTKLGGFPDLSMMIQGAVIYVAALLYSLAFVFYALDATVRLGIVGTLLPLIMASWAFKPTKGMFFDPGWGIDRKSVV